MKFLKYSAISLLGLVVASIIFYLLHSFLDINAYYSNLIGDGIALFMVFLYSWYFIFDHSRKGFKRKLIFNTISKILVIYLLSILLWTYEENFLDNSFLYFDGRISNDLLITIVKVCLAPLSLILNYLATYFIVEVYFKDN